MLTHLYNLYTSSFSPSAHAVRDACMCAFCAHVGNVALLHCGDLETAFINTVC